VEGGDKSEGGKGGPDIAGSFSSEIHDQERDQDESFETSA